MWMIAVHVDDAMTPVRLGGFRQFPRLARHRWAVALLRPPARRCLYIHMDVGSSVRTYIGSL